MLKDYPKEVISFYNEIEELLKSKNIKNIKIIDLNSDKSDRGATVSKELNSYIIRIDNRFKGNSYYLLHELLHIKIDLELGKQEIHFKNGDKTVMSEKTIAFVGRILYDFNHHYLIAKEIHDNWSEFDSETRLIDYNQILKGAFAKYSKENYEIGLDKTIEIIGLLANGKIQQNDFYQDYQVPHCDNTFIESAAERIYQCARKTDYNKDSFRERNREMVRIIRELLNEFDSNINFHDYFSM